jgi:hypothetical protein
MFSKIEIPKVIKHRSVANSPGQKKSNTKQAFGFVDNRPKAKFYFKKPASNATQFLLQRVAQLERFDAGNGAQWHIHHEHIKLGKNSDSRVEFNQRSAKEIRKELGEKIDRYKLNVGGALAASFRECINYINANY